MTKKNSLKKALITSALSMVLCSSMFVGTTYAWFTDSVTSGSNIIQTGTLDVGMYYADGTKAVPTKDEEWADASNAQIFNSTLWEPGHTEVRHIKIANEGTLALKYQLNIIANGEVSELANVIDVYYADPAVQITNRTQLTAEYKIGTLAEVLAGLEVSGNGALVPAGKEGEGYKSVETVTIALKMQETAGNEYKNKSIGSDFTIQLLATQYTYEKDSIGPDYDKNAPFSMWDGVVPAEMPETLVVDTEKYLISINDAAAFAYLNTLVNSADFYSNYGSAWKYSIELNADIDLANKEWTPITLKNFVAFEGNGHTIKNLKVNSTADYAGLFAQITCNDLGHTNVRNFTIDGASVSGKAVGAFAGNAMQAALSNVNVNKATVNGTKYVGGLAGRGSSSITNCSVKNSTVTGSEKTVGGLVGYSVGDPNPITVKGNTVEIVTVTGAYNVGGLLGAAQKETVENNTVKDVKVISTTALPTNADATEVRTGDVVARNYNATIGTNTVINVTCTAKASASTADELQTAIASGKPVTLTDDIAMDAGNFTVAAGTKAVIDLGGNDLTVTDTDGATPAFLKVEGDLTITGEGNVDVRQINTYAGSKLTLGEGVTISTSNAYAINNSGTTEINGATINHTGTNHAIQNNSTGTLIINDATVTSTSTSNISTINSTGGTVTIHGGTFTHNGSMGSVICDPYGNSEIIINGGTFTKIGGDSLVNVGDAKLTIYGGIFDSTSMFSNLDTNITIHAGVFKNNAKITDYGFGSISSMIPATSTATTNADGSITVTKTNF